MRCRSIVAITLMLTAALTQSTGAADEMSRKPITRISGGEWIDFSKPELVEISKRVLAMPDIPFRAHEEIIRVRSVGMDWDIASMVYEPQDPSKIPAGADGRKVGLFLLSAWRARRSARSMAR